MYIQYLRDWDYRGFREEVKFKWNEILIVYISFNKIAPKNKNTHVKIESKLFSL